MTGSKIVAAGHYQPERVLTNAELSSMVDTTDEWITSRVGIRERRIAAEGESVDQMSAEAARRALTASGLAPEQVDLVIVATFTAIDRSPNIAARVAAQLGLDSPAVMDLNVACSGFTHALALADHAIRAGSAKHAIVIGAEKFSDFTDWTDRTTCVLLGDGAGAVVVSASPDPGIGPVLWGSVPAMGDAVRLEGRDGTSRRTARACSAGRPVSCRRWPGRSATSPESRRRTSVASSCIRRTCGSSCRSPNGSAP